MLPIVFPQWYIRCYKDVKVRHLSIIKVIKFLLNILWEKFTHKKFFLVFLTTKTYIITVHLLNKKKFGQKNLFFLSLLILSVPKPISTKFYINNGDTIHITLILHFRLAFKRSLFANGCVMYIVIEVIKCSVKLPTMVLLWYFQVNCQSFVWDLQNIKCTTLEICGQISIWGPFFCDVVKHCVYGMNTLRDRRLKYLISIFDSFSYFYFIFMSNLYSINCMYNVH